MNKPTKILIIAFLALILTITISSRIQNTKTDLADYAERRTKYASEFLPELTDLPEYKEIDYKYHLKELWMFAAATIRLTVTYDKETYESEKKKLEENSYLTHPVRQSGKTNYTIPAPEFTVGTHTFKVLSANDQSYPKSISITATSDQEKTISYLYFHNPDQDYISESTENTPMQKLIEEYFPYNW